MVRSNRSSRAAAAGSQRGRWDGEQLGWESGYHCGRCEAVRRLTPSWAPPVRNVKVLFIPQGFPAIDNGAASGLERCVGELIVGSPSGMAAQAAVHKPHLVLVMNGLHVFPQDHLAQIDTIRKLGIKTAIWFADDPYFTDETAAIAPHYDFVATHEQGCIDFYKSLGCPNVFYMPLAVNAELFRPQPVPPSYRSDVCFVGTGFWNRIRFFDRLAPYLAGKKVVIAGGKWERMAKFRLLQNQIIGSGVPVEESIKYYNGAKIVINLHRGWEHSEDNRNSRGIKGLSVNPRTYEIAACGAFQLTDVRQDLPLHYAPGIDIATYNSPEELAGRIDYYLKHEDERRALAYNGLKRTLQQHSFVVRADQLLSRLGY